MLNKPHKFWYWVKWCGYFNHPLTRWFWKIADKKIDRYRDARDEYLTKRGLI